MVFANTESVQPHLVGVFDLLDELLQTGRRVHRAEVDGYYRMGPCKHISSLVRS